MIAGLHWTAWLLLFVAIGLGLSIELRFYLANRASDQKPRATGTSSENEAAP